MRTATLILFLDEVTELESMQEKNAHAAAIPADKVEQYLHGFLSCSPGCGFGEPSGALPATSAAQTFMTACE